MHVCVLLCWVVGEIRGLERLQFEDGAGDKRLGWCGILGLLKTNDAHDHR